MRAIRDAGAYTSPALMLLLCVASAGIAREPAQKHEAEVRSVRGTVVDADENVMASARVYLKNVKTLAVRTYISDEAGHYQFSGLDPNVDYQVHAENDNLTSGTHNVSAFDSRKEIVITLKVNKRKGKQGYQLRPQVSVSG